jgi:hypothetical protein
MEFIALFKMLLGFSSYKLLFTYSKPHDTIPEKQDKLGGSGG